LFKPKKENHSIASGSNLSPGACVGYGGARYRDLKSKYLASGVEADKPALASSRLLSFESFFPYTLPQGINYLRKNLKKWMGRQHRHVAMHLQPASARVVYQPLGVVGIISPWNYPVLIGQTVAVEPDLLTWGSGSSGHCDRTGQCRKHLSGKGPVRCGRTRFPRRPPAD